MKRLTDHSGPAREVADETGNIDVDRKKIQHNTIKKKAGETDDAVIMLMDFQDLEILCV